MVVLGRGSLRAAYGTTAVFARNRSAIRAGTIMVAIHTCRGPALHEVTQSFTDEE